ncbi:MAG: hypothetical protein ABWZ02_01590, partial [Nakamurella sp.]
MYARTKIAGADQLGRDVTAGIGVAEFIRADRRGFGVVLEIPRSPTQPHIRARARTENRAVGVAGAGWRRGRRAGLGRRATFACRSGGGRRQRLLGSGGLRRLRGGRRLAGRRVAGLLVGLGGLARRISLLRVLLSRLATLRLPLLITLLRIIHRWVALLLRILLL